MNSDRYEKAIRRNIAEINNAILERRALIGLHAAESAHGLDFFRISAHALFNDVISHTIKVFERSAKAASFWYVVNTDESVANLAARRCGVNIEEVERRSALFKSIRDLTHFHIDRKALMDPAKVWGTAGATGDDLGFVLEAAWKVLAGIAKEELGENYHLADYDGTDVERIIRAYKAGHPDVPITI